MCLGGNIPEFLIARASVGLDRTAVGRREIGPLVHGLAIAELLQLLKQDKVHVHGIGGQVEDSHEVTEAGSRVHGGIFNPRFRPNKTGGTKRGTDETKWGRLGTNRPGSYRLGNHPVNPRPKAALGHRVPRRSHERSPRIFRHGKRHLEVAPIQLPPNTNLPMR